MQMNKATLDLHSLKCSAELKTQISEALLTSRTHLVREALAQLGKTVWAEAPEFKLSIARSITLESQLDFINLALATLNCRPSITLGDFGSFETLLWNPRSPLLAAPQAVLVLWRLEDLYPDVVESFSALSRQERLDFEASLIKRLQDLCAGYVKVSTAPLFIATLPDFGQDWPHEVSAVPNLSMVKQSFNRALMEISAVEAQINVFDFAAWCAREGKACFDERLDLFARQPLSANVVTSFSLELARLFRPIFQPRAKVLLLDLDNTLWGGTIGDDGMSGLKVGRDYPGNVFRRIQSLAKRLKESGVLLALVSKNNIEPVQKAFETLPDMVLRWEDFVVHKVDWNPKHQNIQAIASELNLGLDSFVFLDDNHLEREEVKHYLPQVQVLDNGGDPYSILTALRGSALFDAYRVSAEDSQRTELYSLQAARSIDVGAANIEEFLASLSMEAIIEAVSAASLQRVVQMLGKTNQFNVTTRRHSEAVVRDLIKSERNILLTVELVDRFGSQGIVGLIIGVEQEPGTLLVDSFLLSCRVIGRGVEESLWSAFVELATGRAFQRIRAQYIPTEKNAMVADLFVRLGMQAVEAPQGEFLYELGLPAAVLKPDWIKVKVKGDEQSRETV
ncbi:MAG: HAD-IIIC family phosphatase [Candidatus Obscuribacter phosphatis]|uniref:HAD-IIIC family phosphatase n=1 Tax=Candidatus Obscuribacter phosphatis TaxID=1906157 RepID=A0A8J7PBI0_9BACT|nr:HAD-IIIC family phosphatase [Candidatus Obscuribacter phosphatis]